MKSNTIASATASLLLAARAQAQETIYSGVGFGTYYYDIEQVQVCNTDFEYQNMGNVECNLSGLTLDQMNTEYVVAMNHTQLVGDLALYCGKKVLVTVNGVTSDLPLFIGDGCARCGTGSSSSTVWNANGAPGLDFSYTVLSELSNLACSQGHIDISWEIVDETLYNFDTNAPGQPQGPVNQDTAPAAPTTTTTTTPIVPIAAPTTLVTQTTPASTPTPVSPPSGSCSSGTWQCNGNVMEECLNSSWTPMVTCPQGLTCQGGNEPYCG